MTGKKQKRAVTKTKAASNSRFAALARQCQLRARAAEKLKPGDAEVRRKIFAALAAGSAYVYQDYFAELVDDVRTSDQLEQLLLDMGSEIENRIGLGRLAELYAAVLSRLGEAKDHDSQTADDLVRAVKVWAFGDVAPPAGELVNVRPGMRVNGVPAQMDEADGLVLSVTPHGAFVLDDKTGDVVGLDLDTIRLYAAGSTVARNTPQAAEAVA